MGAYRRLFSLHGSRSLTFWGFLARVPLGMITLALLLVVRQHTGSLAEAALVSGANAVGAGVTGPIQGPMLDRVGISRMLMPLSIATSASLLATLWCIFHAPLALIALASGLAGFTRPQVTSCTRAMWVRICTTDDLRFTASALEGTAAPVFLLVGPLLVTVLSTSLGPTSALLCAAAITLVGQFGLANLSIAKRWKSARIHRTRKSALRLSVQLRWLICTIALAGVASGAVTLGLTAFATEQHATAKAGILFSALAAGGLVGGTAYGSHNWPWALNHQLVAVLAMDAGGLVLLVAGNSVAGMTALALLAGILASPSAGCTYHLASSFAPPGALSETFSWVATVGFLGSSVGQAGGGWLATAAGSKTELLCAACVAALGAVVSLVIWAKPAAASPLIR